MKTFSQYVQEHNPLAVKSIVRRLNPLDKQMRKLKRIRKLGVTGLAKQNLLKKIGVMRPASAQVNKVKDELKKEKKARKKDQEKLDKQTKKINDLEKKVPGHPEHEGI